MTFSTTALWRFVILTESFAFMYSPMDTNDTLNYMVAEDGMKTWLSFFPDGVQERQIVAP
jgi:hypothetical protein